MEKKYIVGGAAALGLILFLMYRKRPVSVSSVIDPYKDVDVSGMNIPGYQGGDFISNITVEANPSLLAMLSNKFMPLFGFVGTTTIGVPVYVPVKKKCSDPFKYHNPYYEYLYGIYGDDWCNHIRMTASASGSPGSSSSNDATIRSA